jgi:pyrimidine nucleoside transport protein
MPMAYLMGVEWSDAGVVGELVGIKTFLNEFIAYQELGKFIKNRSTCTGEYLSVSSQLYMYHAYKLI